MKIRNFADSVRASSPSVTPSNESDAVRGGHARARGAGWDDGETRPSGKASAMWGKHGGHRASDLPDGKEPAPTTAAPSTEPSKPTPSSAGTTTSKPTPSSASTTSSTPTPSSASTTTSRPTSATPSTATTGSTGATAQSTTSTYAALSMDALYKLAPAPLKAQWANIDAAAKKYGVQPQLLVAMAMVESTGGTDKNAYSNGGGMFQFTDVNTRAAYGLTGKTNDDAASVEAAAHYISDSLKAADSNLSAALRTYNGPIGQGGASDYQTRIQAFMNGQGY